MANTASFEGLLEAMEKKVIVDPFVGDTSYASVLQYVKMILLFPLALIRIFCLFIVFWVIYFSSRIASEAYLRTIFPFLTRIWVAGFGFHYVPVRNRQIWEMAKKGKIKFVAVYNHISFMDGPLLAALYPFAFVINAGHGNSWWLRHIVKKMGYVVVNHTQAGSGQTQKVCDHVEQSDSMLCIAPEGTTTNGKILLRYPNRHCSTAWATWPPYASDAGSILLRMFCQFCNSVEFELLPLVYPHQGEAPAQFAERVREVMAASLQIPMVDMDRNSGSQYLELCRERATQRGRSSNRVVPAATNTATDTSTNALSCTDNTDSTDSTAISISQHSNDATAAAIVTPDTAC